MKKLMVMAALGATIALASPETVFAAGARAHVTFGYVVRPRPYYRGFGFAYDPWLWGPGWGFGYPEPYVMPVATTGALRLEIKPKTAQVFVDGYYAGVVDDFNGHFHHLDLTPGGHRIEVRQPGFQPLVFETYIQLDHTIDYKATLTPLTP
jgi:hypothetical protein